MQTFLKTTRYLTLVGVISLLLASLAAFGWGAMKTFKVIITILISYGQDAYIAIALIEIVDSFLIATALLIFALSMYELFINKLDLPAWMLAHNLPELKAKLGGVIVLVMVVKFLEHLVEWKNAYDTLLFGLAVSVVSGALIALSHFGKEE
jgi:uncharacterized membrane protein YqhA